MPSTGARHRLDGAGLIVDLTAVEFMGASTLGVIARARELLRQRSASFTVRGPQPSSDASSACAAWTTSSLPASKWRPT